MPYVPGNAAEGFCENCKVDTVQTVLEVDGLQVRLVRCEKCGLEGPLKMARAKTRAGLLEVARKRNTIPPPRRTRKKPADPAQIFRKMLEGKELVQAPDYNLKMELEEGQVIKHPKFGVGVVDVITGPMKANIIFEDGARILMFGKK